MTIDDLFEIDDTREMNPLVKFEKQAHKPFEPLTGRSGQLHAQFSGIENQRIQVARSLSGHSYRIKPKSPTSETPNKCSWDAESA